MPRKSSTDDVFAAIRRARLRQDQLHGPLEANPRELGGKVGYIWLVRAHLNDAAAQPRSNRALSGILHAVALGVRALEEYGVPEVWLPDDKAKL